MPYMTETPEVGDIFIRNTLDYNDLHSEDKIIITKVFSLPNYNNYIYGTALNGIEYVFSFGTLYQWFHKI